MLLCNLNHDNINYTIVSNRFRITLKKRFHRVSLEVFYRANYLMRGMIKRFPEKFVLKSVANDLRLPFPSSERVSHRRAAIRAGPLISTSYVRKATHTEEMTKNITGWHWNVNALSGYAGAFYGYFARE